MSSSRSRSRGRSMSLSSSKYRSSGSSLSSRLGRVAKKLVFESPASAAASAATEAVSALIDLASGGTNRSAQSATKQFANSLTKRTSRSTKSGRLAGKVKGFKKVSKKLKGKKGLTRRGLANAGVHTAQELRFTTKIDSVSKYEAIAVGHNSFPTKVLSLNMARAMIKWLFNGVFTIRDFSLPATGVYGLRAGDIIRVTFYISPVSIGAGLFDVTIVDAQSFEQIAIALAAQFEPLQDIARYKWENIRFLPLDSNSRITSIEKNLNMAKVKVITKSVMKVQNRTAEDAGADPEADDLDNCPLIGYTYHCKGNNFYNRNSRRLLRGLGTVNLQTNEVMLYEAYGQQPETIPPGSNYHRAAGPFTNSSVIRPAEPPKPYEIKNCLKSTKTVLNPGEIKTSIVSQEFEMSFHKMCAILYDVQMTNADHYCYNPEAGFCRVMYLEKAIGNEGTSVSIAAETQIDCWMAITGKENKTTNPITFQSSYFGYDQQAP